MNIFKLKRQYVSVVTLILVLSSVYLFNNSINEKIEKTIYSPKTLEQEGDNYRLVTSADNVQVPVPKGYVASNVTGENYVTPEYQYTQVTHKGNYTQLNWSSPEGEQYPWTQDENGIWISGNQRVSNSESVLESEEFDYIKGTTLTINYTYSGAYGNYLNIELINLTNNTTTRIVSNQGENTSTSFNYIKSNYTWKTNNGGTGRYKIRAIYKKSYSENHQGKDSGYIKTSTYFKENENGTKTFEEEIKTKIHDGGFVIYQLTDSELEINPNGTNIIINDTNKDTAQSTRNQYVWVPVANIEDIVRTKMENDGIMQFGQNYVFYYTPITKETSMSSNYFREPRLVENIDKTKFYLQKYSNQEKRENYLNNMQENYAAMIKSIIKYKGFYIGRYETGDEINHWDNYISCFKNPKIVKYNRNISYSTWYESYIDLQRLSRKTEKYVKTGMLHDSLWDYTLKWINETDTRNFEETAENSGTWGNYDNTIFKYKESANGFEITKNTNSPITTPTGGITELIYNGVIYIDFPTASNNIFDIAGNVFEWTVANNDSDFRRIRDGYYNNRNYKTPSLFSNCNSPYAYNLDVGVRAQLNIL